MAPLHTDQRLIAQLLERPAGERGEFLERACKDEPRLLERLREITAAVAEAETKMATRTETASVSVSTARALEWALHAESEAPGARIGPYKLLQAIGEGGFGTVWMAEQEQPVRRRVALKIVKVGMDTKEVIARFEAERQALALMDHPNIARVFDAGATKGGRPYFVMELVRGIPLTQYCDHNRLATEARLKLFATVCRAVQHAHQKGIIHRDLKPSNILVTLQEGSPVPKIIDFGIAKATQGRLTDKTLVTQFHAFVGTPVYTSPEQMELSGLDVDTRSDIYSLGVLLYELLTGRLPFDPDTLMKAGLEGMRHAIREVDPPRPSNRWKTLSQEDRTTAARVRSTDPARLSTLLRGDLDWIVMHCLEKDRTRRYETANDLALDVERHLTDEPIVARPPSRIDRTRKFIRRHRVGVLSGAAIVLALAGGLVVSSGLLVRERIAYHRALAAEAAERNLRDQAEKGRFEEARHASRTSTDLAEERLEQGKSSQAVALLVRAAQSDPKNHVVAPRLLSLLAHRNFLVPEGPPLRLGARVFARSFSPDGRTQVILCEDGTVALLDLQSGGLTQSRLPSPPELACTAAVGRTLLACLCEDGAVRVIDGRTGRIERTIEFASPGEWAVGSSFRRSSGYGLPGVSTTADPVLCVRLANQEWVAVSVESGRVQSLPDATSDPDCWFNTNGRWLVLAQGGRGATRLELWDLDIGEMRTTVSPAGPVQWFEFSPDGERLLTISSKTGVDSADFQVWTIPSCTPIGEPRRLPQSVWNKLLRAAFSRDSQFLALGTFEGAQVFRTRDGAEVGPFVPGLPHHLELAPNGQTFFVVQTEGARIWRSRTAEPLTPDLSGESLPDWSSFSDDGALLLTGGDGLARLWDAATGQLVAEPAYPQEVGADVALSPDGQHLVVVTAKGDLIRFRVAREAARPLVSPGGSYWGLDGLVFAIFPDHAIELDSYTGRFVNKHVPLPEPLRAVMATHYLGPEALTSVIWTEANEWQVWKWTHKGVTRTGSLDISPRNSMVWRGFSRDFSTMATLWRDDRKTIDVWDLRTGSSMQRLRIPEGAYSPPAQGFGVGAFSADALRFVCGSEQGIVYIWNVETGRVDLELELNRDVRIRAVDFRPDGTHIVAGDHRGHVRVWDARTGVPASPVLEHRGGIQSVEYSRDGRYLLTVGGPEARIWDGETYATVAGSGVQFSGLRTARFSPDGRTFMTSAGSENRVWDTRTGRPVSEPLQSNGRVFGNWLWADGRRAGDYAEGSPGELPECRVWSIPVEPGDPPAPEWLLDLATVCAGGVIDQGGNFIPAPVDGPTIEDVRRQLEALPDDAPYVEWGRWIVADRATRSIAPGIPATPAEADAFYAYLLKKVKTAREAAQP